MNSGKAYLSFYSGKKVFITGHTGFKGSWLVKILSMAGAEIKGYALPPATDPDLYSALEIDKLCTSVFGDIMDREKLIREIEDFAPDVVFHLAAQPLVRLSYDIPAETFGVNAIGTAHVLDAVRKINKPCTAILITTDKVYHNNEWNFPYRENDRLGGYDPYSASKACAELVIDSYRNSFFNRKSHNDHKKAIVSARAGNVIGGGDFASDRIIPDCVRAAAAGKPIMVRNPHSTRPFQHVLEPLAVYLTIAMEQYKDSKYQDYYNVGPDDRDCVTTGTLTDLFCNAWGEGMTWENHWVGGPHEANFLKLDCSKIKTVFGWKPRYTVKEAVEKTVEWSKEYLNGADMLEVTDRQIREFFA